MDGGDGDDTLYADGGSNGNTLLGGAGNDTLIAHGMYSGDNTFEGGTGNDTMSGSWYADTYRFNLGDGQDTISEVGAWNGQVVDKLVFGPGIEEADIAARRVGNSLVLSHVNGTDTVTVAGWFTGGASVRLEQIEFASGVVWDSAALTEAALIVTGTAGDDVIEGTTLNDTLYGMGGNDTLHGAGGANILDGGDGDDAIYGNGGSNTLIGGAGDDTLLAERYTSGNVFEAGTGNDTMTGGWYDDTYRFNLGDGQDTITETGSINGQVIDKLVFGPDIQEADITAHRVGNHMVFSHANGVDEVIVTNWYVGSVRPLEQVEFANGTIWYAEALTQAGLTVTGTAGDDVIEGTTLNDTLYGMGGNDTLYGHGGTNVLDGGDGDDTLYGDSGANTLRGGAGSDTLIASGFYSSDNVFEGGAGNDSMTGSYSGDTYLFNLGDGQDTIIETGYINGQIVDKLIFGPGISAGDVTVVRTGSSMVFQITGSDDQVTVNNWFGHSDGRYKIEEVSFADGTVLSAAHVGQSAEEDGRLVGLNITGTGTVSGTMRDDNLKISGSGGYINGGAGNDTLGLAVPMTVETTFEGGTGNDTITGSGGKDSYIFNLGDGHDYISDDVRNYSPIETGYFNQWPNAEGYQDRIFFGEGITKESVTVSRTGNDMVLTLNGGADSITVKDWLDGTPYTRIENIVFHDGSIWRYDDVETILAGGGTYSPNNNAPAVIHAVTDQTSPEEGTWTFEVPAGTFKDVDGDSLTYVASLANGDALPTWLSFDPTSRVFNGIPPLGSEGSILTLKVVATDGVGASANVSFGLTVLESAAINITGTGTLQGTRHDDTLTSTGDATLIGAAGNDTLTGSYLAEKYVFNLGDGHDTITDDVRSYVYGTYYFNLNPNATWMRDEIQFGSGISKEDVTITRSADDMVLTINANDSITVKNWFDGTLYNRIEKLSFADDTSWMANDIEALQLGGGTYNSSNNAPIAIRTVSDQQVTEEAPWSIALSAIFVDIDDGDQITYSATLSNGDPLPSWVSINPANRTINARPPVGSEGSALTFKIRATDSVGAFAETSFGMTVLEGVGINISGTGTLIGTSYDDVLTATGSGGHLIGLGGNDNLTVPHYAGNMSDNTYEGGAGDDMLVGSYGRDTYIFNLGDGHDTIADDVRFYVYGYYYFDQDPDSPSFRDEIRFGAGISKEDVTLTRVGNDMVLTVSADDSITVKDWYDGTLYNRIEKLSFADSTSWTANEAEILLLHGGVYDPNNNAPIAIQTLADSQAQEEEPWSVTVPAGTFTDIDGDTLTYSATLANGDALPAWVNFNATTMTLSGRPPVGSEGSLLTFKVTATDAGGASADVSFDFTVLEGVGFTYTGSGTVIGGSHNDTLNISGSGGYVGGGAGNDTLGLAVPMTVETTFEGGTGNDTITGSGGKDSYIFNLGDGHDYISDDVRNYSPIETGYFNQWPNAEGYQDRIFFGEGIAKEDVTISRTGNDMVFTLNGGADSITVKDWLDGTPYTRIENIVFHDGTIWRYDDVETILAMGGTYSASNNAPAALYAIADQALQEEAPWSFTVPGNTFRDIDGDELSYTATLANGDALPTWISFDSATRTFSGTPPAGSFGDSLSLKIIATDAGGATGNAMFDLEVATEAGQINYTGVGTVLGGSYNDNLKIAENGGYVGGGAGNDTLGLAVTTIVETTFEGGTGNDTITGSGGKDSYIFNLGDGHDYISDDVRNYSPIETGYFNQWPNAEGYQDRIFFGPGITKEGIIISRTGNDMVFTLNGGADSITVKDWLDGTPYTRIEELVFDDGSVWRYDDVETILAMGGTYNATNNAPAALYALADQELQEEAGWSYTVPGNTFKDLEGDTLIYSATLANGDALPSWISFNAATRTFSGTPPAGTLGDSLSLKVIATDTAGASGNTLLEVSVLTESGPVNFTGTGTVIGGSYDDVLSIYGDGGYISGGAGDDALSNSAYAVETTFEGGTGDDVITGSYGKDSYIFNLGDGHDYISDDVRYYPNPGLAQYYFNLHPDVEGYQDRIFFGEGIAKEDVTISRSGNDMVFTLNGGADSITVKDWLDGTPYTRIENIVFHDGTIWRYDDVETILAMGGTYSASNNAPAALYAIADQALQEEAPWSFTVPGNTFRDIDGDELSYTATLANGDALPTWISFDSATRTFSGTPPAGSFGDSLSLKIIATDAGGATGNAMFDLEVATEAGQINYTGVGTVLGGSYNDNLKIAENGGYVGGGAGNDTLGLAVTTIVETTFEGGTGNDTITGSGGKDSYIFNLGDGHDYISDDVRNYSPIETGYFNQWPNAEGYQDRIFFGPGITKEGIIISRTGNDMVFTLNGGADSITVKDWLDGTPYTRIEELVFDDGSVWRYDDVEALLAMGGTYNATNNAPFAALAVADQEIQEESAWSFEIPANTFKDFDGHALTYTATLANGDALPGWMSFDGATQTFSGTPAMGDAVSGLGVKVTAADSLGAEASETFSLTVTELVALNLSGGGVLQGTSLADTLTANVSAAQVIGGAGDDVLGAANMEDVGGISFTGGLGNDVITGSYQVDTYHFNRGDGHDTVTDDETRFAGSGYSEPAPVHSDYLVFGSQVSVEQIWFRQVGDDLDISVIGTSDHMTIKDWYTSPFNQIENFVSTADNYSLSVSNVDSLVQAMAAFSPPAAGETSLSTSYANSLSPVIAANWQQIEL